MNIRKIAAITGMILIVGASAFAAQKKIGNVQIITGGAGGGWEVIGAAIASKANEHFEGFPVTAIPGPGSVANPMIVSSGETAFGIGYPNFLVAARDGLFPYDKAADNLATIASMPATVLHIFVDPAKAKEATFEAVLDKKVPIHLALPPQGAGSHMIFHNVVAAYGLKEIEDMKAWGADFYYANVSGINEAWRNRMVDGGVSTLNIPGTAVEEALSSRAGVVLPIGEGLVAKLVEAGFSPYTIPAGTYSGQKNDVATVGLPMILFTRKDVDEDTVYEITKTIYENAEFLKAVHSSFKTFDPNAMHLGTGIDLHPGAVRFYKEKGLIK